MKHVMKSALVLVILVAVMCLARPGWSVASPPLQGGSVLRLFDHEVVTTTAKTRSWNVVGLDFKQDYLKLQALDDNTVATLTVWVQIDNYRIMTDTRVFSDVDPGEVHESSAYTRTAYCCTQMYSLVSTSTVGMTATLVTGGW